MRKTLLFDVNKEGYTFAALEDDDLMALETEKPGSNRLAGNIYRGKVVDVIRGINAAFVDIGHEKNAYLYIDEVPGLSQLKKIEHLLSAGQEVTVQVIKDAAGSKGTRVTMNISLTGRLVVLTKGGKQVSVSKKIKKEERNRLKEIAGQWALSDYGILFRTASQFSSYEDIYKEFNYLVTLFREISRLENKGRVPRLLKEDMDLLHRIIRDKLTHEIEKLVIHGKNEYKDALAYADLINSGNKQKISLYQGEFDLLDVYNVKNQIKMMNSSKIWLKCGGFIVIDKTEALTVIDVNSGKNVDKKKMDDTIFSTNTEAVFEIARQVILRNIGGIIIIDFIDMEAADRQDAILRSLRKEFRKHDSNATIIGFTKLGLVEMTRKKNN